MNLPPNVQKEAEKWASIQGLSLDEFVTRAIIEKVNALNQQMRGVTNQAPQVHLQTRAQWLARIRTFRSSRPVQGEPLSATVLKVRQEEGY
jgi:hypothetical protein